MFSRAVLDRTWTVALCFLGVFSAGADGREWTDASGKFRIEAELVAVRNGKVILEKADGSVITVPLDKLSTADQEFLKAKENPPPATPTIPAAGSAVAKAPAPAAPPAPAPVSSVTGDGAALANSVKAILQAN